MPPIYVVLVEKVDLEKMYYHGFYLFLYFKTIMVSIKRKIIQRRRYIRIGRIQKTCWLMIKCIVTIIWYLMRTIEVDTRINI